jgi:uncharacterized protein YjeT (DUF2065 family)
MADLVVAIGLVLVIEGILFAAIPGTAKRIAETALAAPEGTLRISGILCAILGVVIVWLVRG